MSGAYWLNLMYYGGVGVPDSTAIFQDRSDKGGVGLSFYLD